MKICYTVQVGSFCDIDVNAPLTFCCGDCANNARSLLLYDFIF